MDNPQVSAGGFSSWLTATKLAIRGTQAADVPCGTCVACCTSSQFIHVAPDEIATLSVIPPELLFPAPRLPKGHLLMGYDKHGRCPMLIDNACSIYVNRPRTCRTYDCRVFAATGITVEDPDKALIAARVKTWEFDYPSERDRNDQAAVSRSGAFVQAEHPDGNLLPRDPTQQAVLAIELSDLFQDGIVPDLETVKVAIEQRHLGSRNPPSGMAERR